MRPRRDPYGELCEPRPSSNIATNDNHGATVKRCPICKKQFESSGRCPEDGATLVDADPSDPLIGSTVQGYRIERAIGSGGLGAVYLAKQLTLDRYVAIKVLHQSRTDSDEALQRFLREARLLSQLNHPNIVQIIEFGNTETGVAFLAMEYVTGMTLREYVDQSGGLHLEQIFAIGEQLCAAVQAAHEMKIIHRDLKPQNVIISANPAGGELVKLLDFGIGKSLNSGTAELTNTSVVLGTPGYLAPEQIQCAKEVDPRADVYALGAILYYMIAGRPPYRAELVTAILAHQLMQPPAPLVMEELHDPSTLVLEEIVMKALARDANARFQSAKELAHALRSAARRAAGEPTLSRPSDSIVPSLPDATPKVRPADTSKRRMPAAVAAVALLFLASGLGWWGWSGPTASARSTHGEYVVRGVSSTEIVLGMSAPFSGAARELGRAMKLGIETALAEVNETGGVHGRRLRLVALDDSYDPERALKNVKELISHEKVFAFIGNVGTPTTLQVLPLLLSDRTIIFAPFTGTEKIRRDPPDRYVFNYRASYREETEALVKHLIEKRHVPPQKIGTFIQDDSYGAAGLAALTKILGTYNVPPESIITVRYARNSRQVEPAVEELLARKDDVDAVVVYGTYSASAKFTKLVRQGGMPAIVANVSFVGSESLAQEFLEVGSEFAKGVIVSEVVPRYDAHSTLAQHFRVRFERAFPNEQPSAVSLEGYVAAKLFVEGLRRTGRDVTTERLATTLESLRSFDIGSGAPLSFSPSDHQASHRVWAVEMDEKGKLIELDL